MAAEQATGALLKGPYYLGLIASFVGKTATEDALDLLAEALARIEQTGERWFEPELHRLKGEILQSVYKPALAEAETEFRQAITIARAQGARFWELRAATSLAQLWYDQSRREDARSLLAPVYTGFTEGSNIPDLEKARALMLR